MDYQIGQQVEVVFAGGREKGTISEIDSSTGKLTVFDGKYKYRVFPCDVLINDESVYENTKRNYPGKYKKDFKEMRTEKPVSDKPKSPTGQLLTFKKGDKTITGTFIREIMSHGSLYKEILLEDGKKKFIGSKFQVN